jgi:SAM-dependent methyltransferase
MDQIPILIRARAHLDSFDRLEEGKARLRGWIFRPDIQINRLDIHLNGKRWVASLPLQERPDVRAAYHQTTIAKTVDLGRSGFDVTAPQPEKFSVNTGPIISLSPLGADGCPLESFHTYFHDLQKDSESLPQPPKELQDRIGGSDVFLSVAGQLTSLILSAIGRYRSFCEPGIILDWGCGCGRVMGQMMKLVAPDRLHGCDIDAEAVSWDQQNLPGPHFRRIEPYPPTTYPDDFFDIIYGISVMTHLDEETQLAWLRELQRISRPGAILALSVIGENLRQTKMPAELLTMYGERGFASYVPDYSDSLAEYSHRGYYKESYHRRDYLAATWGEFFEILECVETKHQDLLVLRAH